MSTRYAFLLLLLAPWASGGQDANEPLQRIREIASAAVAAQAAPTASVSADALDPRLRLPACASSPQADPPTAMRGSTITVAVHCAEPSRWTVHVPVRLRDPRPVLALVRAVQAGELVADDQFQVIERDIALLPFGHLEDIDTVRGQQFRRALQVGATPAPADLVAPRWVKRGQFIQLISRSGGIEVRAEGKALADGAAGHRIRVENRSSRRVVEGVVRAPGVVEVAL